MHGNSLSTPKTLSAGSEKVGGLICSSSPSLHLILNSFLQLGADFFVGLDTDHK